MRILIRNVRRTGAEGLEYSDDHYDGDVVSIGRATDQVIQLKDRALALSHSEIRSDSKALVIRATGEDAFFLNGKRNRSGRLKPGDVIEIGNYTITVRDPAPGVDHALDVEAGEAAETEIDFGSAFKQDLNSTRLSKRGVAWGLFAVILVAFLAIPVLGMIDRDVGIALRNAPVPDDGLWDSGPLHTSHQFMGDDCTACHTQPFTMVRDEECVACHTSITHHVDVSVHAIPELDETRCASCHKEHNEPTVLSRTDQGLCSDCHENLETHTSGEIGIANVGDFEYNHPEFKMSMLVGSGVGEDYDWAIERVALDAPEIAEQSNLIFPHDVHMSAEGIDGPTGEVTMQCSDCHQPEPGGAYMQPIRMESHCADCHLLTFDSESPTRELPHGEPDLVVRLLEEFYAREVLVGDGAAPGRPMRTARRPGQVGAMSASQRDAAIDEALSKAQRAATDVFERTTCKICHVVDIVDDAERASPWQVRPVRIAQVWMPKSWFDHESHVNEDCARCHDAEGSSEASDVNMPAIESCRDCHGGGEATNKLASSCVECHIFHLPDLDLMRPDVHGAELKTVRSDLDLMRPERLDKLKPVRAK